MIRGLNIILHYIKMTSKKQSFKEAHPFEKRRSEAVRIRSKYPDRAPVIIERDPRCKTIPNPEKIKFLVPDELTIGQLIHVQRRRLQLSPEKALFLFINGSILVPTAALLSNVYAEHVDEDGFLYGTICTENTFG